MKPALTLTAYGAALALLLAGGWATGSAVGPQLAPAAVSAPAGGHGDDHGGTVAEAQETPGLAASSGGLTLVPTTPTYAGGTFAFTVTGPDGAPVTAFDETHERRMHLIVVRRDTTGFQHVHPQMAPDGTWSVPLELPAGGSWRAFADFVPTGGTATTLGVDVAVPGGFTPAEHAPSTVAQVDGYTVTLDGELVPGRSSPLTLTVSRDGVPVTDLDPYLGAFGHLVVLRQGDLAFLHVHPEEGPPGPSIAFAAEAPSAGGYRLFLDFSHGGVVRTAEFTVTTPGGAAPAPVEGGHGHAPGEEGHG